MDPLNFLLYAPLVVINYERRIDNMNLKLNLFICVGYRLIMNKDNSLGLGQRNNKIFYILYFYKLTVHFFTKSIKYKVYLMCNKLCKLRNSMQLVRRKVTFCSS